MVRVGESRPSGHCSRSMAAAYGCDICKPVVASHPRVLLERVRARRRARGAAGHERLLPREHPAGRHVFGRAAHAGRRGHARGLIAIGAGREEVRALHEDHRRPAHRSVRRAGRAVAAHLGRTDRRRLRVGSRVRQGAAHGEVVRRLDVVPLWRAGFGRPRDRCREPLQGPARAAQDQVRRCRAARASAPKRRARTSASSPRKRAGTSTCAATAA